MSYKSIRHSRHPLLAPQIHHLLDQPLDPHDDNRDNNTLRYLLLSIAFPSFLLIGRPRNPRIQLKNHHYIATAAIIKRRFTQQTVLELAVRRVMAPFNGLNWLGSPGFRILPLPTLDGYKGRFHIRLFQLEIDTDQFLAICENILPATNDRERNLKSKGSNEGGYSIARPSSWHSSLIPS